jgi:hypothetical protein
MEASELVCGQAERDTWSCGRVLTRPLCRMIASQIAVLGE